MLTKEELQPLVEQGLTSTQIADKLFCTCQTVRIYCKRYGLTLTKQKSSKHSEQYYLFRKAYIAGKLEGVSHKDLVARYNVASGTISHWKTKINQELRDASNED